MALLESVASYYGPGISDLVGSIIEIEHPVSYLFKVEVEGISDSGYAECDGLSDRTSTYDHKSLTSPVPHRIPDKRQVGRVTLRKCMTFYDNLARWYDEVSKYKRLSPDPRRNVVITQLYPIPRNIPILGGIPISMKKYSLGKANIVGVTSPEYNARRSRLAMMTYTIEPEDVVEITEIGENFGKLMDTVSMLT